MAKRFDAFVIFAEMRTGSNHLEALLNGVDGVTGYGELYNPTFVGGPKTNNVMGYDLARRETDPMGLFDTLLAEGDGLPGLRFFHDHDPRMVDRLIGDRRIAKVVLTRNPVDAYISRLIAAKTGQWKLTDAKARKAAQVSFDAAGFESMLADWSSFRSRLRRGLQGTGQTAFEIDFEEIGEPDIMAGLLRFLGVDAGFDPKASKLKRQNPGPVTEKVTNPEEMRAALAARDPHGLDHLAPGLSRPPAARSFAVLPQGGLMFLPIPGAPYGEVMDWMAGLEGLSRADLPRDLSQKELRQWMRSHPDHRKITVIRHPLARAHHVFCRDLLQADRPRFAETRRILRNRYGLALPKDGPDDSYDIGSHRAVFGAWLDILKACLDGQTSLTPAGDWVPQLSVLQGMAAFALPDQILREDELPVALPALAARIDRPMGPLPDTEPQDQPFALAEIYDAALEAQARDIFRRDYIFFGFDDWVAARA